MPVKLPGADALGSPSSLRSGRPVISGSDYGASLVAKGVEGVGAAVAAISEDQRKQDDALDLIKADTQLQEGLRATRREFETDPDYKTFGPRFDEKTAPIAESAGSIIRNSHSRAKWMERARQQTIASREHVLNRGLGLEREHKEVEVGNELSKGQGAYAETQDAEERQRILRGTIDKITAAEATGLIRPKAAEAFRDKFVDGTIQLDIEERLYEDPEGVLQDFGLVPGGRKITPPKAPAAALAIEDKGEHSVITSGSGAKFRVASAHRDRFAGLIADLEKEGIEIKGEQSGGYAKRNIAGTNTPSRHSHGEAIDINWGENARGKRGELTKKLGAEKIREIAKKHGMTWGGDWRNPDDMHFEVDRSAQPAPPVAQRGLARFAGLPQKSDVEVAPLPPPDGTPDPDDPAPDVMHFGEPEVASGDPGSPTRAQYAMLSGKRRQVMINKARIALSHKYQQRLANDIARIDDGEDEERDERGETNFDKAHRVLQPNVLARWRTKRDRALLGRDSIRVLKDMSEDAVDQHIRSIGRDPRTGEEREDIGYATIRSVRTKAEKEWEKIRKQRRKDPAAAVAQSPEVQRAIMAMQGKPGSVGIGIDEAGEPTIDSENLTPTQRKAAAQQIVEATLAAQDRLGVPKHAQRRISKRQAEKLLNMSDPREMSPRVLRESMLAAAKRANDLFGPEEGEKVFADALRLTFKPDADDLRSYRNRGSGAFTESAEAEERFNLLAKQAFGRSITQRDMDRLEQLKRLDAMPSVLPEPGTGMDQGRPYIGQPYQSPVAATRQPNQQQINLLMQSIGADPSKAAVIREQFDSKFGEGAAQRVINRAMSGEKDPR